MYGMKNNINQARKKLQEKMKTLRYDNKKGIEIGARKLYDKEIN